MNNSKKRIDRNVLYITTFLTLYFSSSFSLSTMTGTGRLLLLMGLAVFVILFKIKNFSFKVGLPLLVLVVTAFIAYIVNGESFEQLLILAAYILFPLLFVNCFSFKDWLRSYSGVMTFISAVSLVLYFSSIFVPDLVQMLPETYNSQGRMSHNAFFSIAPIYGRNYGPFWEPGAFQVYINIALIIEFYYFHFQNKRSILILLLALLTTFSTTGYFAAAFIFACVFFDTTFNRKERKSVVRVMALFLVLFVVATYIFSDIQLDITETVFGKIDTYQYTREENSTVGVRMASFFVPFEIFFDSAKNVIFGVGTTQIHELFIMKYGHSMTTCTFANLFAIYGFLFAILFLSGILKFAKGITSSRPLAWGIMIAILICTLSEDFSRDSSFFIIPFYGLNLIYQKNQILENNDNA